MKKIFSAMFMCFLLAATMEQMTVVNAATVTKTFVDDFKGYDASTCAAIGSDNKAAFSYGAAATLAQGNGYSWVMSGVNTSAWYDPGGYASVYLNTSDGYMAMVPKWYWPATVNLDVGSTEIDQIQHVSFSTTVDDSAGVRLFVGTNEKTFIEFATGSRSTGSSTDAANTIMAGTPYVLVSLDQGPHAGSVVSSPNTCWAPAGAWAEGAPRYEMYMGNWKVDWDITVSGSTISWTAYCAAAGKTFEGNYTDTNSIISSFKYPLAVMGDGDGNKCYLSNLRLTYVTEQFGFTDDFSSYTSSNAATSAATAISGTAQTIAQGSDYKWMLSGIYTGYEGNRGSAYVNTGKSAMAVAGGWNYPVTVNLDMSGKDVNEIQYLSFKTKADSRTGMRIAVSEDEKSFIEFGTGRRDDGVTTGGSGTVMVGTPYVVVSKGNGTTYGNPNNSYGYVVNSPSTCWALPDGWGEGYTKYEMFMRNWEIDWTITVDGTDITCTAYNPNKGYSWTYTFTDLSGLLTSFKYPAAIFSKGENNSFDYIYDIKMDYGVKEPLIAYTTDDNSVNITVSPQDYNASGELNVITAFYGADGQLLTVETNEITDLTESSLLSVSKNKTAGSYGKIFVWSGTLSDLSPFADAINIQ